MDGKFKRKALISMIALTLGSTSFASLSTRSRDEQIQPPLIRETDGQTLDIPVPAYRVQTEKKPAATIHNADKLRRSSQKISKSSKNAKHTVAATTIPSYETIQKLAHGGEREKAKQLALIRLKYKPTDGETRVLLGYMYTWDGNYDAARNEFEQVLQRNPHYTEATYGLITVERKTGNYAKAFQLVNEQLQLEPDNSGYLYQKALIYNSKRDYDEAVKITKLILLKDPSNEDARAFLNTLETTVPDVVWKNRVGIYQEYDFVHNPSDVWLYNTAYYGRRTPYGTIYGNINYAKRFDTNAFQYEIEAYPYIPHGYVYLAYARSSQSLFPRVRYGIEPFFSLPHGFEFSVGERYLEFSDITRIYTGSISKYVGDYWFSFRPYITPGDAGTATSYSFTARKYYSNVYDYIYATVKFGSGPNEIFLDPEDFSATRNQGIAFGGSKPLTKQIIFTWNFGYGNEDYPNDIKRNFYIMSAGLRYLF